MSKFISGVIFGALMMLLVQKLLPVKSASERVNADVIQQLEKASDYALVADEALLYDELTDEHTQALRASSVDDASALNLHRLFAAEARDESWSLKMEPLLESFMGSFGSQSGFRVMGTNCHTTICEVQAVASSEVSFANWEALTRAVQEQPWGQQFIHSVAISEAQNDRQFVLSIFQMSGT